MSKELGVGVDAGVEQGGVGVKDGKTLFLQLEPEEYVFVAIAFDAFVENYLLHYASMDEQLKSGNAFVGMAVAPCSSAIVSAFGMGFVFVAKFAASGCWWCGVGEPTTNDICLLSGGEILSEEVWADYLGIAVEK